VLVEEKFIKQNNIISLYDEPITCI